MSHSALLRRGIRDLLDDVRDITVVGESSSEQEAVEMAQQLRPEVILVCLLRSEDYACSVIHTMHNVCGARSLGLASHGDWPPIARWLAAGGSGCLSIHDSERDIVSAVKQVAAGGAYISPRLRNPLSIADTGGGGQLSRRELEIVSLVARGYTCAEIAEQLYVSPKTAESHRTHINRKLGLKRRADLVQYAIDHGLLRL